MITSSSTLDGIRDHLNSIVNKYGYFCNSYALPKRIGQITKVAFTRPLGNCVVLSEATPDEFKDQWGELPRHKNVYRVMVD